MKLLSLVTATLVLVAVSASAEASVEGVDLPAMSKHPLSVQRRDEILGRRHAGQTRMVRRGSKRSCKAKTAKAAEGVVAAKLHSSTHVEVDAHAHADSQSHAYSNSGSKSHSSSHSASESMSKNHSHSHSHSHSSSSSSSSSWTSFGGGLFGFHTTTCGSSDANDSQPNGSQTFLNCGLTTPTGWNPPPLQLHQLKILPSTTAANSPVFSPCKPHLWAFQSAEKTHGIPATVLMSFAMQESTCNPSVTGGNGEQGLMQITPDKCAGAPRGDCKDVWFNVDVGARYFKSTLQACGGNVLQAIGQYNGWQKGLTVQSAMQAKWQGNCFAQNNLDYLYQMLNGWFLGRQDAYGLGSYKNLAGC